MRRGALPELNFEHTVPRSLVHRTNLAELFLTDGIGLSASRFAAAAQLPTIHHYYTDHLTVEGVDPLLLLECSRQAETHAVHAHFGAPMDTSFVLRSWELRWDPEVAGAGAAPREFVAIAETSGAQWRGGTLRGQRYDMELQLDRAPVGRVRMDVGYLPGPVYRAMRARRRGGAAPASSREFTGTAADLVEPHLVGRSSADNVVLCAPRFAADEVRARLQVRGAHPSLFDHPQDHVPGMVLMEAARQLSVLSAKHFLSVPAHDVRIAGLAAEFTCYAELDDPVELIAEPVHRGPGRHEVEIRFVQRGTVISNAAFEVRTPGDAP